MTWATTLFANGFGWAVRAMRLDACVSFRCRTVCAFSHRQCEHHLEASDSAPERVRAMLEHLGPTFVKLGQLASLRPDFVPLPYAEALRSLQDRAEPMPLAEVERVILEETGCRHTDLFADLDPEPAASASLSQVHRAVLPDGRQVAVKVQRPQVAALVTRDLELLELIAERLERFSPRAARYQPRRAVSEFAAYTRRELNFEREAEIMIQVKRNMEPERAIVIPAVERALTSKRLLVMEFVAGIRVDDREAIAAHGIDPTQAAANAARALLRQIFIDGLFHADPHPGNVLLSGDDRVVFLDFGMFGRIDPWLRRRVGLAFTLIIENRPEEAAEQLIRGASLAADAAVEDYRFALARLVADWHSGRSGLSVAQLLLRELGLGIEYGVVYPRELMLVARALVVAEGSAHAADPSLDLAALAESALGGSPRQLTQSVLSVGRGLVGSRSNVAELLEDLPVLMPRLIDLVERGPSAAPPIGDQRRPASGAKLALIAGALAGWIAGSRSAR